MKGIKELAANMKPSKNGLFLAVTTIIFTLFTLLIIEVIHRESLAAFFDWTRESTVSFAITFLLLFFLVGSLLFLPNIIFISLLVIEVIFLLIVSFGSHLKFQLRGEYFTPADLYLIDEGADISKLMDGLIGWKEVAGLIGLLVILVLFSYFFVRFKKKVSFTNRLLLSVFSIICFIIISLNPSLFTVKSYSENVGAVESYGKFGFIGAYLTLWEKAKIASPEDYDRGEINRIVKTVNEKATQDEVDENFQPNIIVVLAEALWDPLLLKNVTFKEDPLPYFRSLMEQHSSGELMTHIYGGGTFNTELEILTGLTTRFTPGESYIYQINRPVDSLAHVLKNQGYHTTAVHNFKNWFYRRNEVYRLIGFEKFVSMEFFNNPPYVGPFIDDRELMKVALDELQQTEGPDFLDVITVATHGPYTDRHYEDHSDLISSDMTDSSEYILGFYTKLLKDLDDSIRILIEGVEKMDEPTMVVIYGDHLPFLGEDLAVYKESGYFNGDSENYEEYKKIYQTPLLVWNNFEEKPPKEDLRMTPNFLGSYILAQAKKEMSPIFSMNRDIYNQGITVIPKSNFLKEEGVNEKDLEDFKLLQYDGLNGNQYSYRNQVVKAAEDYVLGSGKMSIESIDVTEGENGTYTLDIRGKNFVSNGKVYLDDKEQETKFISSNQLTGTIKKASVENKSSQNVVIKLLDDKETVIVKTNAKEITFK